MDSELYNKVEKCVSEIKKKYKKYNKDLYTKISKISVSREDDSIPCTTKRISKNSRLFIPYSVVVSNNLTISQLSSYNHSICIGLSFFEYEKIIEKYEENKEETKDDNCIIEKYLIENIGSNNTVSCIVTIMKEDGDSSSTIQREYYKRLIKIIEKKNWKPLSIENISKNKHKGNDKWEGHYYYNIKGGQQENIFSWVNKEPQIFTSYKSFMASQKVILTTRVSLLYFMLYIHDIYKILSIEEVQLYKDIFSKYLQTIYYSDISCYQTMKCLPCISKNNELISPILCKKLSIDDFTKNGVIHISHNISVSKNIITYCEKYNILLSDYYAGNLFWDFRTGNMQQQNYTINEYWEDVQKRLFLRKDLYI